VDQDLSAGDSKFLGVGVFYEKPESAALRAAGCCFGFRNIRDRPDEDDGTGFTGREVARQFTGRGMLPSPMVGRTGAEEE
jgi:hypothetical protein